jgi:peptide/nickel transport system substrate-binding protein
VLIRLLLALFTLLALAGCGPPGRTAGEAGAGTRAEPARPLIIIVRVEPASLAARSLQQAGTSLHVPRRMFNALLAVIDDRGLPRPDLAESLPQLNSDSWRVLPEGRMETTYRLKPNLTWHDGTPLSAEDFVFSWRVYATPALGYANTPPMHGIEEVRAADPRTLQVSWRLPYPGAATLSARDRELPALPRHLLQEPFEQQTAEAFATHSYWTREYVGVGPYRVERWEPGSFIEAVAFDGYALGRARIERIRMVFISDSNTALANLLSGEAHAATDNSIAQVVEALKGDWTERGGKLLHWPNSWRHTAFQFRPELASPRAILDPRVRKALAHAIDKSVINEAVFGGDGLFSESMIWSGSEWGPATEHPLATYPYDARRSEQLMSEAGLSRGTDGFYVSEREGRFSGSIGTTAATDFEAEMLILADTWRRAGFDIQESVLPAAQAQDSQVRATFRTMFTSSTNMGEPAMLNYVARAIPGPENRWSGGNRGGWASPQYDRLVELFNRTLDRGERIEQVASLLRIFTDELPAIPLFFRAQPMAHVPALRGPGVAAPESSMIWNVHEWEFR